MLQHLRSLQPPHLSRAWQALLTFVLVVVAALLGHVLRLSLTARAVDSYSSLVSGSCVDERFDIDLSRRDGPRSVAIIDLKSWPGQRCDFYHDLVVSATSPILVTDFEVPGLTDALPAVVTKVDRRGGTIQELPDKMAPLRPRLLGPGETMRLAVRFELGDCQRFAPGAVATYDSIRVHYVDHQLSHEQDLALGGRYVLRSPPDSACPERLPGFGTGWQLQGLLGARLGLSPDIDGLVGLFRRIALAEPLPDGRRVALFRQATGLGNCTALAAMAPEPESPSCDGPCAWSQLSAYAGACRPPDEAEMITAASGRFGDSEPWAGGMVLDERIQRVRVTTGSRSREVEVDNGAWLARGVAVGSTVEGLDAAGTVVASVTVPAQEEHTIPVRQEGP